LSYGLTEDWQVGVKLGLTDVKSKFQDAEDPTDKWSTNFDNEFAWGIATKYTFLRQNKVDWGVSAQMNWLTGSYDEKGREEWDGGYEDWKEKTEIDAFDLLVAVGPTFDMGGWKLYGGAFYYYMDGDIDWKGSEVDNDGFTESWKESGDLEADGYLGGFIGAQFSLSENTALTTEVSATADGWALGTGITFKF
jgi:hypothetical protein